MLQPIGSLPPVVYWRRRLLVLGPIVLILLTVYVVWSGGSEKPAAAPSSARPAASRSSSAAASRPATRSSTAAHTGAAVPTACAAAALKISAASSAPKYKVNQQPTLLLQVINAGSAPCVEDLSDQQIELLVYNGQSRVWGSHDCLIQPGTSPETLPVGMAVRRSIVWTGLSSQPQCAGTRQRVGAGSYTLHARLGGVEGATANFTIS